MKKILVCLALFACSAFFKNADAQVRLNVNINIGSQPVWGPVGYDYVEYYYLPDIECYYYVPTRQFVYISNGRWTFSYSLPYRYRAYNLYTGYKVVVNEPRAYLHFKSHKARYAGYRGNHSQVIIRNSNDPRYFGTKGHPKYKNRGNNNGRHNNKNRHGHH